MANNLEKMVDSKAPAVDKSILTKVADWYFEPKSFEKNGLLYELLGVKIFKKYVPTGGSFWNKALKERWLYGHSQAELKRYKDLTMGFETAHIALFFPILASSVLGFAVGGSLFGMCLAIANLFGNVYPIMAQRYNRNRINQLLKKRDYSKIPQQYL